MGASKSSDYRVTMIHDLASYCITQPCSVAASAQSAVISDNSLHAPVRSWPPMAPRSHTAHFLHSASKAPIDSWAQDSSHHTAFYHTLNGTVITGSGGVIKSAVAGGRVPNRRRRPTQRRDVRIDVRRVERLSALTVVVDRRAGRVRLACVFR